ncbi:MAG: alpha/beta fold hydrolase [Hyphomicrobium sp.]
MSNLMARTDVTANPYAMPSELTDAAQTAGEVLCLLMKDPAKLIEAQSSLFLSYVDLWSNSMLQAFGDPADPPAKPGAPDNRFKDPEWSTNPYFTFWKQAYLLTTDWAEDLLHQTDGLEGLARDKAEFYFRLLTSALSPSNFPLTNPEVLRETFASNGENLVQGMRHFVSDIEKSGDLFTISQTDTDAFELGRNLAVTEGKVVFQNELFQLIQYAPATDKVYEVPLLIVPPWINKYYILDLTPQKSFVKYAVDQGFTVFIISWVNPDARLAHKTFEDYAAEGLLAAADAVQRETGAGKCSVLGYCIGGTLVGTTLAYLAARDQERFSSATFLTTQFDFSMAGDLAIFTSEDHLSGLEDLMAANGYLDSSRIANVFNMMRPKDLIWPYVVNNYLLGRKPVAFDILYWNQDSTRMPAANHKFYLREFYSQNRLALGEMSLTDPKPAATLAAPAARDLASKEDHIVFYLRELLGHAESAPIEMTLKSIKLNLKKVRIPVYELATKEDHIAPAVSVFKGSRLFGGDVTFVLAGSGHIAGVVNPPGKLKYQFWTNPDASAGSLEHWIADAKEHPGSWWPHWTSWLAGHSGEWTPARDPGAKLGVIEAAPGSYVRSKR